MFAPFPAVNSAEVALATPLQKRPDRERSGAGARGFGAGWNPDLIRVTTRPLAPAPDGRVMGGETRARLCAEEAVEQSSLMDMRFKGARASGKAIKGLARWSPICVGASEPSAQWPESVDLAGESGVRRTGV